MKLFVAFACLLAVAAAIDDAKVVQSENQITENGFKFGYELDNGQQVSASGELTDPEDGIRTTGSYKYTAPDGQIISLSYVASDEGFEPTGDHVPKIPVLIQRSLDYLAEHAPLPTLVIKGEVFDLEKLLKE